MKPFFRATRAWLKAWLTEVLCVGAVLVVVGGVLAFVMHVHSTTERSRAAQAAVHVAADREMSDALQAALTVSAASARDRWPPQSVTATCCGVARP